MYVILLYTFAGIKVFSSPKKGGVGGEERKTGKDEKEKGVSFFLIALYGIVQIMYDRSALYVIVRIMYARPRKHPVSILLTVTFFLCFPAVSVCSGDFFMVSISFSIL